ncbi:hypothetical protein SteCoe_20165 [Stentor coeruleus]|uniref:Uncharacterized protein n=1 Tax=Stentor coeruleus TaxID=5963 RepID=A0A1R2BSF5_9CILI|nr:hypothetical protein SteCoe_20165 [Stentor coeruleus]
MNRFKEETSRGNSWISIRSLIKESKINSIYSKRNSDSSLDSLSPSPQNDSSITMEWKPNTYINQSVCFSSMHDNYCGDIQETCQSIQAESESPIYEKDIEAMKYYIHRRDSKFRKLQKTYNRDVMQLKDEVVSLQGKLTQNGEDVKRLTSVIEVMKKDHIQQLQNIQARHERKLQRSKQDLDVLLSDINEKTALYVSEKLTKTYQEEIEKLRDYYETKIEDLRLIHEFELNEQEKHTDCNEDLYKELEECKKELQTAEKKCSKEINNLKRLLTIQREENLCLKKVENHEETELKKKLNEVENENLVLKETIESYGKTIDELSIELQGMFKKKKKATSGETLEGGLSKLLGQINSYLDNSDFMSSKDFGETLKSLQNKIELLASGKILL